jgi:hypothetical protein
MRLIRLLSLAVVLVGASSLASDELGAANLARPGCGVCHSEGCPVGPGATTSCQSVCGGSENPYCTWSPFCRGTLAGGPMLVCFPNEV